MKHKTIILSGLLLLTVAAVLIIVMGYGATSKQARPDKPDIILISVDSLRPDHLGCYGYPKPTSPTIDKLAAGGVRFENAISTTSWTLPAHAALFTGLYDSAHGLVDNGLRLADAHVTLAEVLSQAGYQTAGFFGGPYLHPTFGLGQGFDTYQSCMTTLPDEASYKAVRFESRNPHGVAHVDITGPRTLKEFKQWLAKADDRPMFVFLHFWDVHYDYIPPKKYIEMFDPDYKGTIGSQNFMWNKAIHPYMAPRDLEHVKALYDGEIRFTDDVLGEILAELKRSRRSHEPLIVFTADHGEEFFEHGGKGHQRTLFDELVKVPLIFSWPGYLRKGVVPSQQVRLIDVMPTILALAGVKLETEVQGRDISMLLEGDSLPEQSALCEILVDRRKVRAVRTSQMKASRYSR